MQRGDIVAGRFEVQELAGSGGMGAVFRALDRLTGEVVALKVLLPRDTTSDDRFLRESEVLARLDHPAIVRYIAHGQMMSGEVYLVMEWLGGEDLRRRLAREPLTEHESLSLGRRIAEALAVAHAHGIVHRDIKPSNLFLPGGQVTQARLIDFGIARLGTLSSSMTRTGLVMGTLGYMAPEQVRGVRELDGRVDIFSLGCVLFECLTGRTAFLTEQEPVAVMAKIILEDPPRLRELRPDLPAALDELLAHMLAKEPRDRPGHAAEVATALMECEALTDRTAPQPQSPAATALTGGEQRLMSVVLLGSLEQPLEQPIVVDDSTQPAVTHLEIVRLYDTLAAIAQAYGGRFVRLPGGVGLVTLGGVGPATDQAARAARCALALRRVAPEVPMAVAMGRGVAVTRSPTGEVIERAARLLRLADVTLALDPQGPPASLPEPRVEPKAEARAEPGAGERARPIRLDEIAAGLLDVRFVIGGDVHGLDLRGERELEETTRTLLNRPIPCVGRDREIGNLLRLFDEVVSEPVARAVLIAAAAGVGKSRLRYEFLRRVRERGKTMLVLMGRGDPMSAGSPFGLLAQAIRRALGLSEGEEVAVARHRLRARVASRLPEADVGRVSEFLGELVGIHFPDEASVQLRAARRDPLLMGDQMRRAWEDWLRAEASEQPVLLVLEDLQWGDLPTVKLIDSTLAALHDAPLLVLAIGRPEVFTQFPRLWEERGLEELHLSVLTRRSAETLVREALGERATPPLVAHLIEQAGGNAFYLEELIRAVTEGHGESLPATLLAMVQSRLESFDGMARRVLRAGSVFGAVFWRGGVASLLGLQTEQIHEWLEWLVDREVLVRSTESQFAGEMEFRFRHAFVREAAYAMLTAEDRRLGHCLAAEWLVRMGQSDAIVLAEHYERGERPALAALWFHHAAVQALEGNDFEAAVARVERGLTHVERGQLGESGALYELAADAHLWRGAFAQADTCAREAMKRLVPGSARWYSALGQAVVASARLGRPEALESLAEILEAQAPAPDAVGYLLATLARITFQLLVAGRAALASRLMSRFEPLSEAATDDPMQGPARAMIAVVHAQMAHDHERSLHGYQALIEHLDRLGDLRSSSSYRVDLAFDLIDWGAYREAEQTLERALVAAERLRIGRVTAVTRGLLGYVQILQGRSAEARPLLERAIAEAVTTGDRRSEFLMRYYRAKGLLVVGDLAEAAAEGERACALAEQMGQMRGLALTLRTRLRLAEGRGPEALAGAREMLELVRRSWRMGIDQAVPDLLYALALDLAGEKPAARAAIQVARDRVLGLAARISDPERRRVFLEEAVDNARILALAREWLGPEAPTQRG
ncbi:MAG TPA: protein kinase [Polyangia bacterium]|jgi:tetratricopeptide (TPR) repeat protein|nr:protein kinase [Polyangia bacterium]